MARDKELRRDAKGRFFRNLGWKQTPKGYGQHKFYLGRDEANAKIASLKLEALWEAVRRRWKQSTPQVARPKDGQSSARLVRPANDTATGTPSLSPSPGAIVSVGVPEMEYVREGRPVWDRTMLTIADAIRKGDSVARVPLPEHLGRFGLGSSSVGDWLDRLRLDVPIIHIELADAQKQREAEAELHEEGVRLIERGRRLVHRDGAGETLHAALKEYVAALERKHVDLDGTVNATGTTQVRQARFLQEHLPDCPLSDLDTVQILLFQETLALRPPGKRVERISARSARNCIKQLRHFVRWLNSAPGFSWKRPYDLEFTTIRIPETANEKAAMVRRSQVEVYQLEEIQVLWQHATPLKRLLMLLGLNCGFDAKMIATLQREDVHLRTKHPRAREIRYSTSDEDSWIFRLRNKTSVYGEWKLWPITVEAIEWWLQQRTAVQVPEGVTALLVNGRGRPYDAKTKSNDRNPQIPNLWRGLTEKIRRSENHQSFRKLSFGKLRKTAGNLIRAEADGEVAGVFLCHGTPVKSDGLLDVYTNRPFVKVFDAIDIVGQQLRAIWSSAETPFPEVRKKGGPNISPNKIRKIQRMRRSGFNVAKIAEEVGVDRSTVYRWGKGSDKADNSK